MTQERSRCVAAASARGAAAPSGRPGLLLAAFVPSPPLPPSGLSLPAGLSICLLAGRVYCVADIITAEEKRRTQARHGLSAQGS